MEDVDLVLRDQIDVTLDLIDTEEVARHVEVRAAPGEPRTVEDPHAAHPPRAGLYRGALNLRWQKLSKRLPRAEQPLTRPRFDSHGALGDAQLVRLSSKTARFGQLEGDDRVARRRPACDYGERVTRRAAQEVGEVVADGRGLGGAPTHDDLGLRAEAEALIGALVDRRWFRNHADRRLRRHSDERGTDHEQKTDEP